MALLPPFFLDTVVALGGGSDPLSRRWVGTGFIFGNLVAPVADEKDKQYRLWLITNKHVLSGLKEVYIKFNSATEPNSADYRVELVAKNGKTRWIGHEEANTDVAAIFLNAGFLTAENRHYSFIRSDQHVLTRDKMATDRVTEGDRVFVLGFPMGLVAAERQYVICRSGSFARVRDYLENRTRDYLVDAPVFPGNSGGPVIICPSALAIQGTNTINKADFIGVVKSYVPYQDAAVSQQTGRPRILFEENSGLTAVEGAQAVLDTVALAEKRLRGREAQAKFKAKKEAQGTSSEQGGSANAASRRG